MKNIEMNCKLARFEHYLNICFEYYKVHVIINVRNFVKFCKLLLQSVYLSLQNNARNILQVKPQIIFKVEDFFRN